MSKYYLDRNELKVTPGQENRKTYLDKTLPILNHYKKLNLLHEIEGKTGIDQIFAKISGIIASLEA